MASNVNLNDNTVQNISSRDQVQISCTVKEEPYIRNRMDKMFLDLDQGEVFTDANFIFNPEIHSNSVSRPGPDYIRTSFATLSDQNLNNNSSAEWGNFDHYYANPTPTVSIANFNGVSDRVADNWSNFDFSYGMGTSGQFFPAIPPPPPPAPHQMPVAAQSSTIIVDNNQNIHKEYQFYPEPGECSLLFHI